MKINLPVILLKGIVLLPHNELRLEFEDKVSKTIIDTSEMFHDNKVLIVSNMDVLEENFDINTLPKIGVIAKITHKLELPNGTTRVILKGMIRANIYEYLNPNEEIIEAILAPIKVEEISEEVRYAMIRKIYRELESYIKNVPYMSNSILSSITNEKDLSKITDIIATNLPISNDKQYEYLLNLSPLKRVEMILEDIYNEEQLYNIEKKLDLKVKKELDSSQKEFLLREKMKLIKEELGDINLKEEEIDELKEKLNGLKCSKHIYEKISNEIKKYEMIPSMSPEINGIRTYIDCMLSLPWGEKTKEFENLKDVKKELDKSHFGLEEVKDRIIEYLAVKKQTNKISGPIICLVGPPGVGKTTLAFSIAKAIKRNFTKISVGGINDEAEILGHRKTYLGANPGKIIDGMKRAKSNNPVFLIDEIDKMTKDHKGDPASAMLEVLDCNQNKYFKDNYIDEEFDLSDVMFILTANNIDGIPAPLKDRLEIINITGYTELEKLDIAKKYLIPKILKEHNLKEINILDDAILTIIRNYTKEAGVRELERQLSKVIRKIITNKLISKEKVSKINNKNIEKYLGSKKYLDSDIKYENNVGIVNGLAYTNYGGDVLPIEVNYFKGKGNLILTGSLGSVMKESATIALDYIKSNCKEFGIDYSVFNNNDIHIHVPDGAIPKEGPSAGIALTTAILSALTNKKINSNIAMTGEITLRGKVLPIGGLREKSIGAYRNNIKEVIVPADNKKDIDNLPEELKNNIKFILINDYQDIYKFIGV